MRRMRRKSEKFENFDMSENDELRRFSRGSSPGYMKTSPPLPFLLRR